MAANLALSYDEKKAIASTICQLLREGKHTKDILGALGISWTTWHEWRAASPELAEMYARAQEGYAEHLVLECPAVAWDKALDPKSARVIVDTHLRVAALLCPQRFSQAALDRIAAPPEAEEKTTPEEIAATLLRAFTVASRGALPAPIEAEFSEVPDGDA